MSNYHIHPKTGEAKTCSAKTLCPFGKNIQEHYKTKIDAQKAFENIMEERQETEQERKRRTAVYNFQWDTVMAIHDSKEELVFGNTQLAYIDDLKEPSHSENNDKEIAEFFYKFTNVPEDLADGYPLFNVVEYKPQGYRIKERYANVYEEDGQKWVIDYSYSSINPNHEFPYVDTLENWQKDVDKESFFDMEEKSPEAIDPRTLTLPIVQPGEYNPFLEKSLIEKPIKHIDGTQTQFLSVDGVKVAAVKYDIKDYGIQLHSIETRKEYKHQGYMKTLLKKLEYDQDMEVYSSGSYTAQGFNFTKHLTKHRDNEKPAINFPEFTDEEPFTFVKDWIEGVP